MLGFLRGRLLVGGGRRCLAHGELPQAALHLRRRCRFSPCQRLGLLLGYDPLRGHEGSVGTHLAHLIHGVHRRPRRRRRRRSGGAHLFGRLLLGGALVQILPIGVGRWARVFLVIHRYLVVPHGRMLFGSSGEGRGGRIFASGAAMPSSRGRRRARRGPRRLGAMVAPGLLPRGPLAEAPSLPQTEERVRLADVKVVEHQVSFGHPRSRHLRRTPPPQKWPHPGCQSPG